jgi:ABC-2 type transport system ATP-binding protein
MRRLLLALPVVALGTAAALPGAHAAPAHAAATHAAAAHPTAKPRQPAFTVQTLDFHVTVPNEAVGGSGTQKCLIVGDLYKPRAASPHHRVPVILTTNGFGGSKDDQAGLAKVAARHGYGVLSYSGLGFGGSGCKISLDDPSYDGRAGKQLVSFLGGKTGIATTTGGKKVPAVRWIKRDRRDHLGKHAAHDPRVGMVGGSYGGQIQFAIADKDPRLDAIVPIITWSDLSYSLAPNDSGTVHGVTYSEKAPGTEKMDWVNLFFALGVADGVEGAQVDPSRDAGCANFLTPACKAKAELDANLVDTKDLFDFARHASVESYIRNIRIPTLLMQGQGDSLFNLNESVATYRSLREHLTPVKLVWQSWGHSIGTPQPGEWSSGPRLLHTYEGKRVFAWFARYLKGKHVSTGPRFAYYRDWVKFSGKGPDTKQYGHASHFPVGHIATFYGSGTSDLIQQRSAVATGAQSYENSAGASPLSYSEVSEFQGNQIPNQAAKPFDSPGGFAAWEGPALKRHLDVAGIPTATLQLSSPVANNTTAATELQLFAKVYDVAPDGSIDLVRRLVAPVRVGNIAKPVQVQLPGIVHRFAKGHHVELVVAATDSAYRNSNTVQPAMATTSKAKPTVLRLPVVK